MKSFPWVNSHLWCIFFCWGINLEGRQCLPFHSLRSKHPLGFAGFWWYCYTCETSPLDLHENLNLQQKCLSLRSTLQTLRSDIAISPVEYCSGSWESELWPYSPASSHFDVGVRLSSADSRLHMNALAVKDFVLSYRPWGRKLLVYPSLCGVNFTHLSGSH